MILIKGENAERAKRIRIRRGKRLAKLKAIHGIAYDVDDTGATFWKNGELIAQVKFRFGSAEAKNIFKGKKINFKKLV